MTTTNPITSEQPHDDAEALLPWYATGQLDQDERELVETHLAACADCREQLVLERRRIHAFRAYSPQVESGWTRVRERIAEPAFVGSRRPSLRQTFGEIWTAFTRPVVLALTTAQIAFLTLASGLYLWLSQPAYQALGSSTAPASANLIVMFGAGTTEQDLREALRSTGGSIVGGPTATGAYLVHVDPPRRGAALASLHSNHKVELAEAIDASTGE